MIFSLVVFSTLALMWGAVYYYAHIPYMLFASGIATGMAVDILVTIHLDKH
jgi:hypothetical protein